MTNVSSESPGFAAGVLKRAASTAGICLALIVASGAAVGQEACVNTKIDDPIPGLIPASSTRVQLGTIHRVHLARRRSGCSGGAKSHFRA